MIEIQHTEFASATPEMVWKQWSDVNSWPSWDHGVEWCKMREGHRFELGGEGLLMPKGAPYPVSIRIIECQENKSFTDEGMLPLGTLQFVHSVHCHQEGVKITHSLYFHPKDAEAKSVFESAMLPKLQKELPASVKALAQLVESQCRTKCGCR